MGGDSEDHGDPVRDAGQTLLAAMAAGEALIAQHDEGMAAGVITGGGVDSSPPWNTAAAYAVLIPHAEVRHLENRVRADLGLPPMVRGGSAGNTREAIEALAKLCAGLPDETETYVAGRLALLAWRGEQLRAAAGFPQWMPIPVSPEPECPWCEQTNLRMHAARSVVACLFPRCPSGMVRVVALDLSRRVMAVRRPAAVVERMGGKLTWRWPDGHRQP